jgi:hypothetical protein
VVRGGLRWWEVRGRLGGSRGELEQDTWYGRHRASIGFHKGLILFDFLLDLISIQVGRTLDTT